MSVWMKLKDNYIRDMHRWNLNFTLCLWNIYIYFCILTPYPIINRSKHKLGGVLIFPLFIFMPCWLWESKPRAV